MYIKQTFIAKKCSVIYLILPPKAEDGWIKPDQCQVNSTWLELTYYIETLVRLSLLNLLFFNVGSFFIMGHFLDIWDLEGFREIYTFLKNWMKIENESKSHKWTLRYNLGSIGDQWIWKTGLELLKTRYQSPFYYCRALHTAVLYYNFVGFFVAVVFDKSVLSESKDKTLK